MQAKVVPMAEGGGLEGEVSPSPSSPGGQQPAIHCLPPHHPPPPASNLARPAIQRVVVVCKGPAQSAASLRRNMMQYSFRKWANLFGTHHKRTAIEYLCGHLIVVLASSWSILPNSWSFSNLVSMDWRYIAMLSHFREILVPHYNIKTTRSNIF